MTSPLHEQWFAAASQGELSAMAKMLTLSPELLRTQDRGERCAVYLAALKVHTRVVRWLVGQGASLEEDEKPLAAAFIGGHPEMAQCLLDMSAPLSPNYSLKGMRWFCWLCKHQSAQMVGLALLESQKLELGQTEKEQAFWISVSEGRPDVVEKFIEHGFTLPLQDVRAHMAVTRLEKNKLEILKCLERVGCIKGEDGRVGVVAQMLRYNSEQWSELLDFALRQGDAIHRSDSTLGVVHSVCSMGNMEGLRYLLEKGVDPNQADSDGRVPLMWLRRPIASQMAMLLLEHGADLHLRSKDGSTVLHSVGSRVDLDFAAFLVDRGADLGIMDDKGNTALHIVADKQKSAKVAEYLVRSGADPEVKNKAGLCPGEGSSWNPGISSRLRALAQRQGLDKHTPPSNSCAPARRM